MNRRDSYMLHFISLVLGFLPLAVGGIIYLAFRPLNLRMFSWITFLHLDDSIDRLRANLGPASLPSWTVFALPDGLWLLSFLMVILLLWHFEVHRAIPYMVPLCLIALGSEIGQLFGWVPGHFDLVDIGVYLLAIIISAISTVIIKTYRKQLNTKIL